MRYIFDNDLHIHSKISLCSNDPEQTSERILQYAAENNLKTICLTDHCWDEKVASSGTMDFYTIQNPQYISSSKPLPQKNGIEFLFGCETDMDKKFNIGISKERFDEFDFVVIPTTHFHMTNFTTPPEMIEPEEKADYWLKRFDAIFDYEFPFHKIGIAHLTCGLIDSSREKFLKTIDAIDEDKMKRIFAKAQKAGVGIEINADDMKFKDSETETVLRPYRIAKEVGCKFYMGSDAHHPKELDEAKTYFERAIDLLELTEDDKFILRKR